MKLVITSVDIGIALDIAGPLIMLILLIIGAVKAWPYRKTDRAQFVKIYRPYKYIGIFLWILFNVAGILLIVTAK